MTEVYLGNPPEHIKRWIINHSKPATRETTRIWYDECPAEHNGAEYYDYDIEGTLDAKALCDLGLKYGDGTTGDPSPRVNITKVEIRSNVTSIGTYAFFNCSGLTSITIPDSVTSIGVQAFSYCSGLTSITIPDSVTSIGDSAFAGCTGLTSMTIPDSVTTIGEYAFYQCIGLTSITIPDSVTSIGNDAFTDCSGLTSIDVPFKTITPSSSRYFTPIRRWNEVKTLNFPKLETINGTNTYMFYDCSSLTSVHFPAAMKSTIESHAGYSTRFGAPDGCSIVCDL